MDLQTIFATNEQFHEYILHYCRNNNCTKEEAFQKLIIQDIAKSYLPGGINYDSKRVSKTN